MNERREIRVSVEDFLRQPGAQLQVAPRNQSGIVSTRHDSMGQVTASWGNTVEPIPDRRRRRVAIGAIAGVLAGIMVWSTTSSSEDEGSQVRAETSVAGVQSSEFSSVDEEKKVVPADEYIATATPWLPVSTVAINGYTPTTWDLSSYSIEDTDSVVARVEGTLGVEAMIPPEALQYDEEATKSSGVYTIQVDVEKIQYRLDLDEFKSGTSPLDETEIFEAMRAQNENATLDDARALINEIQQYQGLVDSYNISLLKQVIADRYGISMAKLAIEIVRVSLIENANTVQGIDSKEIIFITKIPENVQVSLKAQPPEKIEEVTFLENEFTANMAAYTPDGQKLAMEIQQ